MYLERIGHAQQHRYRNLSALLEGMLAGHQYFGLDDGHEPGFLAQRGVPCQSVRVGVDTCASRNAGSNSDDGAPLSKTRADLTIRLQPRAQAVEAFWFLFSPPCAARSYFYAGNDAAVEADLGKRYALVRLLRIVSS